jgi:hypothetical protein
MAQFGKRNAVAAQPVRGRRGLGTPLQNTHARNASPHSQADVAAALTVASSGKVPSWTTFGPLRFVALALGTAAILWYVTATYAGEIWRDHRLAGTWQTAYDLRAVDGSCKRYQFVMTFCSAKITSLAEPDRAPVVSEFIMGF